VYRRSNGRREALDGQRIIHFLTGMEWGSSVRDRDFSYIRELYQLLGELILLVIGYSI
jgi:hypothetical protein